MAIEHFEREDIEQRYYARNAAAAEYIAHKIEQELQVLLSYEKRIDPPIGADAYDTPYEENFSLFAMVANGDLERALMGETLHSFVTLRGQPIDDSDIEEIALEVSSHALDGFTVWIPREYLKQVQDDTEDISRVCGAWAQVAIKQIRKIFGRFD